MVSLTGFAGLVYEVTWHRYLSHFVGSQARAAALILAVFLGGLCVGYVLFGKLSKTRSPRALVKLCGWTEVAIGIWALFFPALYAFIWKTFGVLDPASSFALGKDFFICVLCIGLPTLLMGGTLPLLTQGLARDLDDASSFHARVYAINTGGAFLGCLVAGFVLIPQLGLPLTMLVTAPLNILAGLVLLAIAGSLSTKIQARQNEAEPIAIGSSASLSLARGSIVAFLAGFYGLTLQTILMRIIGISLGSSEYSFSMIVAVYILMLALGAWSLSSHETKAISVFRNQLVVVIGTLTLYLFIPYWPYGFHVLRTLLTSVAPNFYVFHALCFLFLALILAAPVGAMGCTMPLLFRSTKDRFGDLGSCVGKLYGWNTVGCVVGALVGGYLLLYRFNLDSVLLFAIAAMALSALLSRSLEQRTAAWSLVPALLLCVLLVSPLIIPQWNKRYFAVGTFRIQEATPVTYLGRESFYRGLLADWNIIDYRDDPNTTISVIEFANDATTQAKIGQAYGRALYVNGKSDGATIGQDLRTTRLLAHLPALLTKSKSPDVAVVGYGTGITIRSLTRYPWINSVEAVEIAAYVKESAHYFDFATDNVTADPKLIWQMGDAYRVLGTSQKKYSVIVSEPSNPWVAGIDKLFSRDFYQLVSSRLDTGGIYAQWFHTYATSVETLGMIVNTFHQVFPNVRIFQTPGDFVILGAMSPITIGDPQQLKSAFEVTEVKKELGQIDINDLETLLSTEVWIPSEIFSGFGFHTLEYPTLAFQAGKDFFMGKKLKLEEFLSKPEIRPASLHYAESTLIAEWIKSKAGGPKAGARYVQAMCGLASDKVACQAGIERFLAVVGTN